MKQGSPEDIDQGYVDMIKAKLDLLQGSTWTLS